MDKRKLLGIIQMPKKKRFWIKQDIFKQWSGYGISGKTLL